MEELQSTSSITTTKLSTGEKTDNTTSLVKRKESVFACECVYVHVAVYSSGDCWGMGPRSEEKSEEKQNGVGD